jgi:rhodanese-related sulfurtransferase
MTDIPSVTVEQLHDMLESANTPLILDVREPWENDLCSLPGNRLIPLGLLTEHIDELPRDQTIVVHCHHGGRSARAVAYLRQQGFTQAVNLTGGINAWSQRIDQKVKIYE